MPFPKMPLLDPKRNQKVFTVEQIFEAFLQSATDQSNGAVHRAIVKGMPEIGPLILLGQMGAATELWLGIAKHLGIEGDDGPYVDKKESHEPSHPH